jgi:hypothetical protein
MLAKSAFNLDALDASAVDLLLVLEEEDEDEEVLEDPSSPDGAPPAVVGSIVIHFVYVLKKCVAVRKYVSASSPV